MSLKKRLANVSRYTRRRLVALGDCLTSILDATVHSGQPTSWVQPEGLLDSALESAEYFDYNALTHHGAPNLPGNVEQELDPFLKEAATRCDLIVDIGVAGWHYAAGLARLTGKRVVAFDANGRGRQMIKEMAILNQVSHLVTVSGWCSSANLVHLVRGKRALVFCHLEGGEFSLFTPDVVEALCGCDVVIELQSTSEENRSLIERFAGRSLIILDRPKETGGAARSTILGPDAERMSAEQRGFQQWLVLRPIDLSSLQQLGENLRNPAFLMDHDSVTTKR